jgi:hypothetical protein
MDQAIKKAQELQNQNYKNTVASNKDGDSSSISGKAWSLFKSVQDMVSSGAKQVADAAGSVGKEVRNNAQFVYSHGKAFVQGASDGATNNVTLGLINNETATTHPVTYTKGKVIGDIYSTVAGAFETLSGITVTASAAPQYAATVPSLGAGAVTGTLTVAAGVAMTGHGFASAIKGAQNTGNDMNDLVHMISGKGNEGAGKPTVPTKTNAGSDPANYVNEHAAKRHIYDSSTPSTPSKTQYGKDVDVKNLVDDTKANPDSVVTKYADPANGKKGITVYKKEYDRNISTTDTPTGQHRVFDNHDNPEKSTHYPYVDRNK